MKGDKVDSVDMLTFSCTEVGICDVREEDGKVVGDGICW